MLVPMRTLKVIAALALLCVVLWDTTAMADITVQSSYMDYLGIDPDPDFDWDGSPIWFTQTTSSYLSADELDTTSWTFEGQQEFSSDYTSGTDSTWFLKTGSEEYMTVDKEVVNNTTGMFLGYTITLYVATLVENSLSITVDGDYDVNISTVTDSYDNVTTTIEIVFDEPVESGESFDLYYILDLSGVESPPPDDGEFGVDEGATGTAPEPGTLALLAVGAAAMLGRRMKRA